MTRPARKRHRDNAKSRGTLPDGKWYRSRRALLGGFAVACLTVLAVFAARPLFNRQADSSTAYLAPQQQIDTLPVLASRASDAQFAEEFAAVDPRGDDWGTEIFHQQALAQLKVLGKLVADREGLASSDLSKLVSPTFNGHALLPELEEIYSDGTIVVQRPAAAETDDAATFDGPQGLKRAIGVLLQPYGQAADLRCDVKIFKVNTDVDVPTTSAYVVVSGTSRGTAMQQNAIWHCGWSLGNDDKPPRLQSIAVENFEQVSAQTSQRHLFADCTEAVLAGNPSFRQQLCFGLSHWCQRLEAQVGTFIIGMSGPAVGDVNGDGLDDLFICETGGLPNRLYIQNADGTATDVSVGSGVDLLEPSKAALIVDLDNDGHQDMVIVSIYSALAVFRGDGTGRFSLVEAIEIRGNASSIVAADYDQDRLLDLYVCGYNDIPGAIGEGGHGAPMPYYDANNGVPNVLMRNEGNLRFRDVTGEVGLNVNNRRFSFAAEWEDYDNDGDLDLYVANDFGRNNLYQNRDGKFFDEALHAGVEDIASGMSVDWGDYDNDGWMDLYVSNMWSSAGNRITFQRRFNAPDQSTKALFQRLARGNTLFRSVAESAGQEFTDESVASDVTTGRWAWGSRFVDLNNDSWQDIVVANGYVTGEQADDL